MEPDYMGVEDHMAAVQAGCRVSTVKLGSRCGGVGKPCSTTPTRGPREGRDYSCSKLSLNYISSLKNWTYVECWRMLQTAPTMS